MKKILISLFTITALVVLVAGVTQAVWTDPAEIRSNRFTTGNADLKLSDGAGSGWLDDLNTFTADDIYPGWTEDFTFYIKNDSESEITLEIIAKLSVLTSDYSLLKDNLKLKIWGEDGVGWTGEYTLRQWYEGQASLGTLDQGDSRRYVARFRLEDVNNNFQDRDLTFTVLLTGTQQL